MRWVERGLIAGGVALGVWCAVVLTEARFVNQVAIPAADSAPVVVTQTLPDGARPLPGDESGGSARPSASAAAPAPGTLLGRLEAPSVQLSATLLEGSDDGTLSRGAGHIEDTPLPGQAGNIGIAGHRDTIFRPLRRVHVGDPLSLTTADRIYRYRISKTSIVGPDDVYVLDPTKDPTLTLVTCYPFEFVGHAPKRFIVQAELVDERARGKP
ncbi:MAG TPA: class D sortase [Vicinamibacterales bacterium]|jgi:sortase A